MDIRLIQMDVVAGDPETNFKTIEENVNKNMDADLIVFPEMCVGGYLVGDEWNRQDFAEVVESYNDKIRELSTPLENKPNKPVAIVWGNIAIDHGKKNEDGRVRKYNAVWAAYNGEYIERELHGYGDFKLPPYQAKTLMPNYRFFDDKRYFTSFEQYVKEELIDLIDPVEYDHNHNFAFVPFEIPSGTSGINLKVGLQVCEDMWYKDYTINPTKAYVANKADFIVNVSASPWTWGKEKARANVVSSLKDEIGDNMVPIYYTNICGAQNNGKNIITFDGRTSVYGANGKLIAETKTLFQPYVFRTAFPLIESQQPEPLYGMSSNSVKYKEKLLAIQAGLRHIAINGENQKWVVGLSGGIDSCLSAAILVATFGPHNVMGVNMPTKYNSKDTKMAAFELAKRLGIAYSVIPIEKALKAKRKSIARADNWYLSKFNEKSLHEENEQARMRGSILMDIAAAYGAFFTNNGNKDEAAMGYASMYGDIAGAVAPLADLTKEEVYGMARFLNEHGVPYGLSLGSIPSEAILGRDFDVRDKIAPSAELRENQTDPLKFGFLCRLLEHGIMDYKKVGMETIYEAWLNKTLIKDFDLDDDLFYRYELHKSEVFVAEVEGIFKKLRGSTFKRVQTPPIIITSKSAFGYDYRESILPFVYSDKAMELRNKIMQQKYY